MLTLLGGTAGKYDARDLDRVREEDTWLQHFLMHQKYKVADAVKMMDTTLVWRKEFGVNGKSGPVALRA